MSFRDLEHFLPWPEQNQPFLEPEKPTKSKIPKDFKSEDQKEQEEECKPDPKLEDPKP